MQAQKQLRWSLFLMCKCQIWIASLANCRLSLWWTNFIMTKCLFGCRFLSVLFRPAHVAVEMQFQLGDLNRRSKNTRNFFGNVLQNIIAFFSPLSVTPLLKHIFGISNVDISVLFLKFWANVNLRFRWLLGAFAPRHFSRKHRWLVAGF